MKTAKSVHLKPISQDQYDHLPDDVRKVYIHILHGVPLDPAEKRRIISENKDFFDWKPKKSFGEKLKSALRRKEVPSGKK